MKTLAFTALTLDFTRRPETIEHIKQQNIRTDTDTVWASKKANPRATRQSIRIFTGGDLRGVRQAWRRIYKSVDGRLYVNGGNGTTDGRRYLEMDVEQLVADAVTEQAAGSVDQK